jgi:hemoglobin|nr:group 1 truncated hemoglobin [Kofleriaceae bacterium]
MITRLAFALALAGASLSLVHVASADPKTQTTKSLYDRLGGKDAIKAVVHDFLGNVAADTKINKRFAKTDIPKLEGNLVDQVCAATGGPCKYTGKDMKTAHKGMKITEDEFNALVGDLKKSLDKFKVGAKEQSDLLGALGGMKGDIVGQ